MTPCFFVQKPQTKQTISTSGTHGLTNYRTETSTVKPNTVATFDYGRTLSALFYSSAGL